MSIPLKSVLSASRRTDIPAFYMDWFMSQVGRGAFEVRNPYNGLIRNVIATPDTIHTIVFWSKNFRPFLEGGYGERLREMGFNLFFNFTINSESKLLEPYVPPLQERLDQLSELAASYSPAAISWRFDPICRFSMQPYNVMDNCGDFEKIASHAEKVGITRCITSFMDLYLKIKRRTTGSLVTFIPITSAQQRDILSAMQTRLSSFGIKLFTCCEKELLETLPPDAGIQAASCIPNDLLLKLYGGELSLKKDSGQRISAGCGCHISIDIGTYDQHPCFHNCLYCYANPSVPPGRNVKCPPAVVEGEVG